ncbi:MAG: patatin-like phospholipase family protein [Sulfurospirillaceae bacterium]|nr:patatin-like phospholipase family protein [Sulfurospirillaceae bacterium]MDD2827020.1 patatin-like phospholipase family protein [Sulfurospirillaceae bacterium]
MKVSLALSGGAARGAFHLGVLSALEECGIEVGAISGTSIGSVIAVGYGSGLKPREMLEIFKSKDFKKVLRFNYFQKGLLKIEEQHSILHTFAPIKRLEDMNMPIFITCVDVLSGKIVRFHKGDAIKLSIASSALIPLFRPIIYENYLLIDGGFMDNLPITPLKAFSSPIFSVDLHPLLLSKKHHFFAMYFRSLFLTFIASSQRQKDESDLYITDFRLDGLSLFGFHDLDQCFTLGYESGKAQILTYLSQTMYNNSYKSEGIR